MVTRILGQAEILIRFTQTIGEIFYCSLGFGSTWWTFRELHEQCFGCYNKPTGLSNW